ncbi:MAG TPA: hypothetical protein VFS33_07535 [Gemmatimonadales bacterium]|nr:hypothetical protein [Gemmatimonadales bacterium]
MTDTSTRIPDAWRLVLLWTGALLPPIAALLDLNVSYMLVTQACLKQTMLPLHLVHVAGVVLTIAGGMVAWHAWEKAGRSWPVDEPGALGSTRFMAAIGVLNGVTFTLVTLALWAPVWVLSPCQ